MKKECELSEKKCLPCQGGTPPLKGDQLNHFFSQLASGWKLIHEHHLEREFTFNDFKDALAFTNQVGALAEENDHHPNIELTYGKVKVILWTHKIDGLSESDFILAAKIDKLS